MNFFNSKLTVACIMFLSAVSAQADTRHQVKGSAIAATINAKLHTPTPGNVCKAEYRKQGGVISTNMEIGPHTITITFPHKQVGTFEDTGQYMDYLMGIADNTAAFAVKWTDGTILLVSKDCDPTIL